MEKPTDDYSKGVVFYLEKQNGKIVGVLTWNMFGKMDVARQVKCWEMLQYLLNDFYYFQILMEEKTEADISDVAAHFPVH